MIVAPTVSDDTLVDYRLALYLNISFKIKALDYISITTVSNPITSTSECNFQAT